MSGGESYEYPSCEQSDCYCQNHWPNRSGGREHSVINNEDDGEKTIRCEVAIHNCDDITTCAFCEKYMLGSGLYLYGEYVICVRCQNSVTFTDAFVKIFDTGCKYATLFIEDEDDDEISVVDTAACTTCKKKHTEYNPTTAFKDEPTLREAINEIDYENKLTKPARKLFKAFSNEIKAQLDKAFSLRREKKAAIHQHRLELQAKCDVARKRLLTTFIPILTKLSDVQFETHVPTKFARLTNEAEIKRVKRLCTTPNEMTTEDVIAFAKFLSQ